MKSKFITLCAIVVIIPNVALATTPSLSQASNNAIVLQLITALLEQIKNLQAQLDVKRATESSSSTVLVQQVDRAEYQIKAKPLIDELDEVQDDIEPLQARIEQKSCSRPRWIYFQGEREFSCAERYAQAASTTDTVLNLKDDLVELEEREEDLLRKIDRLKTRYGI